MTPPGRWNSYALSALSEESKKVAELYPDVVNQGGLPQALQSELDKLGSSLQATGIEEGRTTVGYARIAADDRSSQVFVALEHRALSVDFWHRGVCHGGGWLTTLQEAASAIQAFVENRANVGGMVGEFGWFENRLPVKLHNAAALVENAWQSYLSDPCEHRPMDQLKNLIHAAAAEPKLRQLFPFTSMDRLCFSRTTGYPYTRDGPLAFPVHGGLYRVAIEEGDEYRVLGEGDASTAVALLCSALPPDIGPAIDGTAEDL